ncbi:hypothetical protein [Neobacillus thermocopriae]|uniref:Uncharacterized protein n=1 Tax=Neobacillus thermocopriae TaxID=1215031 RepID=A0A6B3TPZ5_9BACI|nr:hypothetical protein [Neobacillus thermocopriae]MED3624667.1 hypothetical protein [Neobacillus thermocopriae]MED3715678.1 hypothetical protein [Neobacillus thermocopriae]NEX78692.1 hypothetical protein [Neobacillus thermocopriae]
MKSAIAVEAKAEIEQFPELIHLLFSETAIDWHSNNMFIYLQREEALLAKEILHTTNLFEHLHLAQIVSKGTKGPYFEDYAIQLDRETYCLFTDDLISFYITGKNKNELLMAKYQFEEHLVFSTSENDKDIFFIELHNKELMQNIAIAYHINIFFTLDKREKKI